MSLVNPNDPRAKRTRKYIQKAFTDLLAEKDFEDISIQDIKERADLNRATFYNHFQDKYELLELHRKNQLNYSLIACYLF